MDIGILFILLVGIGIFIFLTNGESKEDLRTKIRNLEIQLENPELKKSTNFCF